VGDPTKRNGTADNKRTGKTARKPKRRRRTTARDWREAFGSLAAEKAGEKARLGLMHWWAEAARVIGELVNDVSRIRLEAGRDDSPLSGIVNQREIWALEGRLEGAESALLSAVP